MTIQADTREHYKEWNRIKTQFDSLGVDYFRSKLFVGDYMSLDNPRLCIDRKKDLGELVGNVTQQHKRFVEELIRAKKHGIKLIILCEHGADIERLSDVYWWHNPRLDITDIEIVNGKPERVQKYPRAVTGQALYKSLCTIQDKYCVDFHFCSKDETGRRIVELLGEEYG